MIFLNHTPGGSSGGSAAVIAASGACFLKEQILEDLLDNLLLFAAMLDLNLLMEGALDLE